MARYRPGSRPRPIHRLADACGSRSTTSTRIPRSARTAATLIVVVVFPLPPLFVHHGDGAHVASPLAQHRISGTPSHKLINAERILPTQSAARIMNVKYVKDISFTRPSSGSRTSLALAPLLVRRARPHRPY